MPVFTQYPDKKYERKKIRANVLRRLSLGESTESIASSLGITPYRVGAFRRHHASRLKDKISLNEIDPRISKPVEERIFYDEHKPGTPLTLDEEQDLARQIQNGSVEARNKLIMHNLPWIYSVIKSVSYGLSYDNFQELKSRTLESVLIDAVNFKPVGCKFISYLGSFLSKRLLSYRREFDSNGRENLPPGLMPLRLNHLPSVEESVLNEEGYHSEKWEDAIIDKNARTPDEIYEETERNETVANSLDRLNEREQYVLRAYFFEEKTLDDIAEDICLSRERVRQIKEKALHKLRHPASFSKLQSFFQVTRIRRTTTEKVYSEYLKDVQNGESY